MARSVLLRLVDMRDAINGIQEVAAAVTFDAFAQSWIMQRAVERGLEVISEASRHVPGDLKTPTPDIPWRQIAAIGNLLRHEYQRADVRATTISIRQFGPAVLAWNARQLGGTGRYWSIA